MLINPNSLPSITYIDGNAYPRPIWNGDRTELYDRIDEVALVAKSMVQQCIAGVSLQYEQKLDFDKSMRWLHASLRPITYRFFKRYSENSRADITDFVQEINTHMLEEKGILDKYTPDRGRFVTFYSGVGWRRLNYYAEKNMSQLSTPINAFRHITDPELKARILTATSYEDITSTFNDSDEGLGFDETVSDSRVDTFRQVAARESMRDIKRGIYGLSQLELTVFLEVRCSGKSYQEVADSEGVDAKAIDNAMQRVEKKLRRYVGDDALAA